MGPGTRARRANRVGEDYGEGVFFTQDVGVRGLVIAQAHPGGLGIPETR